ncbi:MAG TPA: lysylphosphatidylglycerol synthase transmembrane domain-containing protein [Solirubrobacteraceae bacterium]|nr:lysylphosphatidylglycerol synthase transmembrane domain-containing protein [Solirubrobacteraceae bacterium]
MADVTGTAAEAGVEKKHERLRRTRHALQAARGRLSTRTLHLIAFVVFVILFLKLIPGFEKALSDLQNVSLGWVVAAMAVETLSEIGYVVSWRGILDPDSLLRQDGRGKHLGARVAWAQLGGGMVVPGGTLGSMGVGAVMLHRLGMPMEKVGERQFTLMFLNSGVDGLAIVFFGLGLAIGVFKGEDNLALTLLPAALVAIGIALALFVTGRAERLVERLEHKRPRMAKGVATLASAVENTRDMLRHRGSAKIVLGAIAYLGFDMLVLQGAFVAIDAHPVPTFAVVSMCYLIGGLAGSIPLPANLGAVGGMTGMLIVFGIDHNQAVAAVVLYQAIGFLVPLIGGAIAYLFVRREFGSMQEEGDDEPSGGAGGGAPQPAG